SFTDPSVNPVTFTATDDVSSAPGFQHDVTVSYANASTFALEVGVLDASGNLTYVAVTAAPQVTPTAVTWPAVTLPEGYSRLRVDFVPPVLTIQSPANGAIFNASSPDTSSQPGLQTTVVVVADDVEPGQLASLTVDCGSGPTTYQVPFDGTKTATFDAVTLD